MKFNRPRFSATYRGLPLLTAKDVLVIGNLIRNRSPRLYSDDTEALILQALSYRTVPFYLGRLVMLRAVNEDADAGDSVALKIEVGLN